MMHEPIATADMSREEQAAVNELRSVFLGKRKLPAFDENHFLELDRLTKVARTAATAARVARAEEEATNALADLALNPPPQEEPDMQPDLQIEPEDGHSSDEDEPPAPPPPLPLPPPPPAAAARQQPRQPRPPGRPPRVD